ncbi:Ger(x)C family spore germination protein [Paenibacillus sp. Marseille-P2973]|uniref:Ger(x)C family spore germination protein n=1 Tax=Paenibacillus sp. Marseille-P2973 TaxID=1871032 RepID=UPI001B38DEAE|nr:Ger(x)C family spore germination protein [Paenibacillus sp. Marseille-P2973]MBQ4899494.1 Ger(x)C family spore germination protein [Paenibacillus sp. Marseille-P2973]
MNNIVKTGLFSLLFVCCGVLLTGCWDSLEIEDRALVLGLAIDEAPPEIMEKETNVTHEKGELPNKMIRITAQIAVPGRVPLGPSSATSGEGTQNSVWVVQVVGHSLDDALNNLQQQIADPRYLIHLRVIVISEAIAKQGLDDLNDYLRRNPEVRRRTWLLVSDVEASKIMDVAPPLERVPTLYLLSMVEKSVKTGKFPLDYLGVFWTAESKWGQDGYLPYISIRGKENILIKGMAYFSEGRLVGTTSPIEIGGFMAAKGMDPGGYSVLVKVPEMGFVMVKTQERHTNMKVEIQNGIPKAYLNIKLEGMISEHFGSASEIDSPDKLDLVEKIFAEDGIKIVNKLIRDTQTKHSDILGIGEIVRARQSAYWNQHVHEKRDWEKIYSDIPVEVRLHMKIRRVGLKN